MLTVLKNWTDKNGQKKWSKNVFAAKNKGILVVSSLFNNKNERIKGKIQGNLQYCLCTMQRDTSQDVKTGNNLQFVEKLTKEEVAGYCEDIEPFDTREIFKSLDPNKIRKYIDEGKMQKLPPYKGKGASTHGSSQRAAIPTMPSSSSFDAPTDEPPF
jgi:hypothetical protein